MDSANATKSEEARGANPGIARAYGANNRIMTQPGIALAETLDPLSEDEPEAISTVTPVTPSRDVFSLGEIVSGVYEIRRCLGEGGMGQVFEATDRVLNRRVAIKAAWPHVDPSSIHNEAQALAAIRHASMATVHAVGRHRDISYVVMERIFGESLQTYLARAHERGAAVPVRDALEILIGIASGLAVVHAAGIAHRDVKPANVMLAPGDRVVLMDFGIFLSEIDRTKSAFISGSPEYIAPETIEDKVAPGDAFLVDVYAFGIVLYEILTGRVPFHADNVLRVIYMHRTAPPPDLRSLRPDAPHRLCALARELLAKDPNDRPATMLAVCGELRSILRNVEATQKRAHDRAASPHAERLSVIVAEDDPSMVDLVCAIIGDAAPLAEVRVASNGEETLALAQARRPHLLLLDLGLPRMSGVEVCMCLRASSEQLARFAVVAISGHTEPAEVKLLAQLGVTRVIAKGPDLAEKLTLIIEEAKRALAPAR
jgi:serine/threonine-protein kinase